MFGEELTGLLEDELEAELAAQAAHVDAGLCRLVELVAECERRLQVESDGVSFAGWLAWRCSLSGRQAREHERIGDALRELPLVRAAFAAGRLSYAKVALLTRVATPETEAELLELAEALSCSQLERAIGAYRRLLREDAVEQQERAFFSYRWQEDGSLRLSGRLAGEEGAVVLRGLDAGREALWHGRLTPADADQGLPADGRPARPTNAEALVALAELALANPGGDRAGVERQQLVVHIDADTLTADAPGRCELADGPPLAAETARRLACDATLIELLERDGQPLALGRRRRTVTARQRRALEARDQGCRFPGCDRTRFLDAHHITHWSHGGSTDLDNLILLCQRHHTTVHEHGYTIHTTTDGEPIFTNQHGIDLPNAPPRPPSTRHTLRDNHQRHGLHIDADTSQPGGDDRMNLADTVDTIIDAIDERSREPVAA